MVSVRMRVSAERENNERNFLVYEDILMEVALRFFERLFTGLSADIRDCTKLLS